MTSSRHAQLAIGDLLDILPDAAIMVDAGGRIAYVNPAMHMLLGYEPEQLLDQPLAMLVPHAARERHAAMAARFRREGVPTMMGARPVLHAVHRSGRLVPVSISLCNLMLGDRGLVSVAVIHDVSALHTPLDRATAQAETDPLTGLGNRLRLSRRMQALLSSARPFALLCLDLERFKPPNDEPGHTGADAALRIVGRRLLAQVRNVDLVAHLGGDEFVLLLDGLDDAGPLRLRALAVAGSLTRPLRTGSPTGSVLGVHIGGALSPQHGTSAQPLLDAAEQAMQGARQSRQAYRLADAA
ncbi:MAG: diguanylate cyclase [Burkholderiaceae bacterium]|nr:diguanylate cyclase [Burkholderiaceae bacterium]